jgi:hypothetical protein
MLRTKKRKQYNQKTRKWQGGKSVSLFSRKIKLIKEKEKGKLIDIVTAYPPEEAHKIKAILNLVFMGYDEKDDKTRLFPTGDNTSTGTSTTSQQTATATTGTNGTTTAAPTGVDPKIGTYEEVIKKGADGSDKKMMNMDLRLKGEISYRLYSYFYSTLNKLYSKMNDPDEKNEEDKKNAPEYIVQLTEWVRRIELLRKPMWADSLINAIYMTFDEGMNSKNAMEQYYGSLLNTEQKGMRVWMNVFEDYSNDNEINNQQCANDADKRKRYNYELRSEPLGNHNTHRTVNDMLNRIFYHDAILKDNKNTLTSIATYMNVIQHKDQAKVNAATATAANNNSNLGTTGHSNDVNQSIAQSLVNPNPKIV